MNVILESLDQSIRKRILRYSVLFSIALITPFFSFSQSRGASNISKLTNPGIVQSIFAEFDSIYKQNPSRADILINKAISISKKNNLLKESGDSYYRLGSLNLNIGKFDSAFRNYETALKIYSECNYPKGIALCYKDLGTVYGETGKKNESLDFYTKGLELAEQKGFEELVAQLTNNIGTVYLSQNHYDKALKNFERSAALSKSGYNHAIAVCNIGTVYRKMGDLQQALNYFQKSLKACETLSDEYCSLIPLNQLSEVYFATKSGKTPETTDKLLKIQERFGLEKDLIVTYNRLGLIYNETKEYDQSIEYFLKSLEIAKRLGSSHAPYIHANMSMVYEDSKQFELALTHLNRFHEMKDSIYSNEQKARTEELLVRFEAEKREKEIELLRKDQQLKQAEQERKENEYAQTLLEKSLAEQESRNHLLKRNREMSLLKKDHELQKAKFQNSMNELAWQKQLKNITIGSALIICIPIVILLVLYRQKIRQKELLARKTEEINMQKTLDLMMSFEMQAIRANIEGQENERRRIAQELHDGIGGSLAGIKMRMLSLFNNTENTTQLKSVIQSVDDVYREVRTLSHHLTPPGMHRYSFVEFVSKYLNDIAEGAKFELEYMFHGEKELNQLSDESKVEIYRILQELINNVIKHAEANFVEVQLMWTEECVNLMVEDRGKGFITTSAKPGIGLSSITRRVNSLGGEINIDSKPGRGTIINVDIYCNQSKINIA